MDDANIKNDIINYFFINDRINTNKVKKNNINNIPDNIINYLSNIYNDSDSLNEKLWRIKLNILNRPVCKTCGGHVQHLSKDKYRIYCSNKCRNNDKEFQEKIRVIANEHHNNDWNNRKKFLETVNNKYKDGNYCNREKMIETFNNKTIEEKQKIINKRINTVNKLYNCDNISQLQCVKEKKIETCIKNYGVNCGFNTEKARIRSLITYMLNKSQIDNKIKETKIKKYRNGCNYEKVKNTKKEKYNDEYYNNRTKYIETCLSKYEVDNVTKNIDIRKKLSKTISSEKIQEKINNTKRKNNSFNKSKLEDISYDLLKEKYIDIIRQYRSELYPFNCDFYIPSLDLYIECNYGWMHGGHPFNENNKEDQLILKSWKDKNTKYYNNAIIAWTIRDVNKRNTAKENKLNYIEFWNINELKNWLNNY